jgi:hypothetical protein
MERSHQNRELERVASYPVECPMMLFAGYAGLPSLPISCAENSHSLSHVMLRTILKRCRKRYEDGEYNYNDNPISPLLTREERDYISAEKKRRHDGERKRRLRDAKAALAADDSDKWHDLLAECYGTDATVIMDDGGLMSFSRELADGVVGCDGLSYDDFLAMEWRSHKSWRQCLAAFCLGDVVPGTFRGTVSARDDRHVCFERLAVTGYYGDGDMFDGKEDHVWMDAKDFESFDVGDCIEFNAEVYMYAKDGADGREVLDFGLRNSRCIERIGSYVQPSDEEIADEVAQRIRCEACMYSDHCDGVYCMMA